MSRQSEGAARPDFGSTVFARWREAAGAEWEAYVAHPFVAALADGSLPQGRFLDYLKQDYLFLIHFSRAWALAVVKSDTLEEMRVAAATVDALVNTEMTLHVETCARHGIGAAELERTEEALPTVAYTRYVLDAGFSGDLLDLLAALAPCVLGYGEIGQRLKAAPHDESYAEWIRTYGGAEYAEVCESVAALIDRAVQARLGGAFEESPRWPALTHRFRAATRLEEQFWGPAR